MDDLIDVIEGNRRYIKCLYVYNKIDVCSIEEVDPGLCRDLLNRADILLTCDELCSFVPDLC
jgi:ribosome-interacting GTPase 1